MNAAMHHQLLLAATALATASNGNHFHIGSWMILPGLILAIPIPIFIIWDRKHRSAATDDLIDT
jgi:hypothetical protein